MQQTKENTACYEKQESQSQRYSQFQRCLKLCLFEWLAVSLSLPKHPCQGVRHCLQIKVWLGQQDDQAGRQTVLSWGPQLPYSSEQTTSSLVGTQHPHAPSTFSPESCSVRALSGQERIYTLINVRYTSARRGKCLTHILLTRLKECR